MANKYEASAPAYCCLFSDETISRYHQLMQNFQFSLAFDLVCR